MNRLYILLMAMVVMVLAPDFFAAHEALAEVLTGTSGNDTLLGTDGEDYFKGRGGDDYLNGSGGNDYLNAGGGEDTIEGGSGNDEIIPGEGDDEVDAGAGNDLIYARDTEGVDYIDCGEASTRWRPYTETTGPGATAREPSALARVRSKLKRLCGRRACCICKIVMAAQWMSPGHRREDTL